MTIHMSRWQRFRTCGGEGFVGVMHKGADQFLVFAAWGGFYSGGCVDSGAVSCKDRFSNIGWSKSTGEQDWEFRRSNMGRRSEQIPTSCTTGATANARSKGIDEVAT